MSEGIERATLYPLALQNETSLVRCMLMEGRALHKTESKERFMLIQDAKQKTIANRLVLEVARYFQTYNAPISMKILAAKYARSLQHYGGLPETVLALEQEGRLIVEITPRGARFVRPGNQAQVTAPVYHW